jgi:hypothetical protein
MTTTTISTCWLCRAPGVVTYPCYDRDVCASCLDKYAPAVRKAAPAPCYETPRLVTYGDVAHLIRGTW